MSRKTVFAFIFCLLLALFMLVTGIVTVFKNNSVPVRSAGKGDIAEFTPAFATETLTLKHSVNLIPIGKDHYYLMMTVNSDADVDIVPFLVRAKPSYMDKNFPSGISASVPKAIKGKVARLNSNAASEIRELNSRLLSEGLITSAGQLNTYYYIDLRYKEFGVYHILCGVGFAVLIIFGFLGGRSGALVRGGNKLLIGIFSVLTLGLAFLMLYVLSVGGSLI